MFKPLSVNVDQFRSIPSFSGSSGPRPGEAGAKTVFAVLHGFYGTQFLSKFEIGTLDAGEDIGIVNARGVWGGALLKFDGDTVKAALSACKTAHVKFPPSLPEFLVLCEAAAPLPVYTPPVRAVGMSQKLRSRYAADARAIADKHRARAEITRTGFVYLPMTLDGLKQGVAMAVALAGGDEVKTLRRLDQMLAPRMAA